MSFNQIDDKCEEELCDLISNASRSLEKLKVTNNAFVNVAKPVYKALKSNERIKVLDLSKNLIDLRYQK